MKGALKLFEKYFLRENRIPVHLLIICLIVAGFYTSIFYSFHKTKEFLPVTIDEFPYLSGAEVFSQINSVKARTMIHESVARVTEADWYGLIYPVFYGTLFKIFGDNPKIFIYLNFLSIGLLFIAGMIWMKSNSIKFYSLTIFFFSGNAIFYLFRFMPVWLGALQGLILFLILLKIYEIKNQNLLKRYIILFLILVLLFSLFRNYFVLFILALFPLAETKKQKFIFAALFAFSFGLISIYLKYFTAINFRTLKAFDDLNLIKMLYMVAAHTYHNTLIIFKNFSTFFSLKWQGNVVPLLLIIVLPLFIFFKAKNNNNKIVFGLSLVFIVHFFMMLCMYDFGLDFYLRHTFHLYFLILFSFFSVAKSFRVRNFVLLLLLIPFLLNVVSGKAQNDIKRGEGIMTEIKTSERFSAFHQIINHVNDENRELSTILLHRDLLSSGDLKVLISLPKVSANKKLIRYTVNPLTEIEPTKEFGKIPIDYLLVPVGFKMAEERVILRTKYFLFCSAI